MGGDPDRLFAAAQSEKDESLRREAIRQLGLVHGTSELEQLYKTETSSDVRREILQAFFLAGDSGKLLQGGPKGKTIVVQRPPQASRNTPPRQTLQSTSRSISLSAIRLH